MYTAFLSLPISGHTHEEIEDLISRMKKEILDNLISFGIVTDEVTFIDNFHSCNNLGIDALLFNFTKTPELGYLSVAIRAIGECDGVFFSGEYLSARECCTEHAVCLTYNVPVYYLDATHETKKGGN